jgi:hypothetical protein
VAQAGTLGLKRRSAAVYGSKTVPGKPKFWFKPPSLRFEAETYFKENMDFMMNTHSGLRV